MKVSSSSFDHEGITHVSISVKNNGNHHICAKCLAPLVIAKAYSQGLKEASTIYHYNVHKYCMVSGAVHGDYIKELGIN